VKKIWIHREIDAPAEAVWELLSNPEYWPDWGPTVKRAQLQGDLIEAGAVGAVTTVMKFDLPFEITAYNDGAHWAWKVAGVEATDHTVEPLAPARCRVGFGVPWPAAPYLAVCRVAMARLEATATRETADA
jgi:hypothetical protein